MPYADLRDEALCWGWIDSRPAKLDAARTMLRMSPRRRGSRWSAINKARVSALEAEGRMTGAGRAAIEAAQADGSWNALDDLDCVPADLAAALAAAHSADWEGLAPSLQRGLLERLLDAKCPETLARRIAEIVARAQATVGRS